MEAIVLAGGLGTRLKAVVPDRPKPMALIAGRPFLEILLGTLARKGVKRAVLSLGHMADTIVNHFGPRFAGIELAYVIEDTPLGTGGAVRLAMDRCGEDHVFVFNGDTYLDLEMAEVEARWQRDRQPIIVGREVPDTLRYGRLLVREDQLAGFAEKGIPGPGLINAGCYVLNRGLLDGYVPGQAFSLENDFLSRRVPATPFGLFVTRGRFIDIGVPEDYARAQDELAEC